MITDNWWLTEFNGVKVLAGNMTLDASRQFAVASFVPTGAPFGTYNLNGTRNRMNQQALTAEWVYPIQCANTSALEALLAAAQSQGTIKKTDGRRILQTQGSISAFMDQTTIEDIASGHKRARVEITHEPFWYSYWVKTVSFTGVSSVSLNTAERRNEGNARAVKNLVFTFTSNIVATGVLPFIITFTPQSGVTATLNITANLAAPVVIDCGAHTITANGVASYDKSSRPPTQLSLLFLEGRRLVAGELAANNTTITFTRNALPVVMSGNISFRETWV